MKGKLLLLVAGALIVAAVFYPEVTKRIIGQSREWVTKMAALANPMASHYTSPWAASTPGPVATAETAGITPSPQTEITEVKARAIVQAYIKKNTRAGTTIAVLGSSDFSRTGSVSAITVLYQVRPEGGSDQVATVRFSVQDGAVVHAEVINPGTTPPVWVPPPRQTVYSANAGATTQVAQPIRQTQVASSASGSRPLEVKDHFSSALSSARHSPHRTMRLTDAYSLAQLDAAKAKARSERKPLGFVMVWGQFFDHEADPRGKGSDSALVHFYEAFHSNLVLVFVRHETELGSVPAAVAQGFMGPDEGGYAPNLAVTDATASEFIVEIPYADLDGDGRDPVFAEKAKKIDEWWSAHPDAIGAAKQ